MSAAGFDGVQVKTVGPLNCVPKAGAVKVGTTLDSTCVLASAADFAGSTVPAMSRAMLKNP
jgi:hypothetical protein